MTVLLDFTHTYANGNSISIPVAKNRAFFFVWFLGLLVSPFWIAFVPSTSKRTFPRTPKLARFRSKHENELVVFFLLDFGR